MKLEEKARSNELASQTLLQMINQGQAVFDKDGKVVLTAPSSPSLSRLAEGRGSA